MYVSISAFSYYDCTHYKFLKDMAIMFFIVATIARARTLTWKFVSSINLITNILNCEHEFMMSFSKANIGRILHNPSYVHPLTIPTN
jgi:hypothetical protein